MKNLIQLPDKPLYKVWAGGFLCPIKELKCGKDCDQGYIFIVAHWGNYRYDFTSFEEAHEAAQKLVAEINGEDPNTLWEIWMTDLVNSWQPYDRQQYSLEEGKAKMDYYRTVATNTHFKLVEIVKRREIV